MGGPGGAADVTRSVAASRSSLSHVESTSSMRKGHKRFSPDRLSQKGRIVGASFNRQSTNARRSARSGFLEKKLEQSIVETRKKEINERTRIQDKIYKDALA